MGLDLILCPRQLEAMDLFSKWPEVILIPDTTVTEAILDPIRRWGLPETIVSDQGQEFVAKLHQELARRLSIKRSFSAPGHPQTNSQEPLARSNVSEKMTVKILWE